MKHLPGLQDVNSDQQNGGLDEKLTYDRITAAKLGQTAQSLDAGLYSAFGQSEVSLIYTQLNQYYVILEVAPQYWASPEGLKDIYFHTASSSSLTASGNTPLMTMATSRPSTTPLAINHTGLFPSVTVSFNLAPGVSLSDATLEIDDMQQRLGTPSSVRGFFAALFWLINNRLVRSQCWSSRLCSRFISFWGSCMRASYIPSRFFPRFLLPASAPCSHSCSSTRI
jgi:multidrug efflux pump